MNVKLLLILSVLLLSGCQSTSIHGQIIDAYVGCKNGPKIMKHEELNKGTITTIECYKD